MAKISEIISKFVISLFNGKIEGVVENTLFDLETKKLKYLVVYSEQNDCTYVLPTSAIYSVGDGAISIKNNNQLTLHANMELEIMDMHNPINCSAFKVNGDSLGTLTDIEIDSKYNVANFIINNTVYNKKLAVNFTKNTLILRDENTRVNVKNFAAKPAFKAGENDNRVINILQIKTNQLAQTPTYISGTKNKQKMLPNRAIANYDFLLNRKVKRNILSAGGSLLIKQNTRINTNVINIARQNGKLKELTKYSN